MGLLDKSVLFKHTSILLKVQIAEVQKLSCKKWYHDASPEQGPLLSSPLSTSSPPPVIHLQTGPVSGSSIDRVIQAWLMTQ